ncbi:unnamed protein product [Effrenium voratum]|nr:unnamed protein product [Effrenium voratum]
MAAACFAWLRGWAFSMWRMPSPPSSSPRCASDRGPWKREPNGRGVGELLPSSRWQYHVLPGGGAVRLRWEKAAGRWKLWAEAGERLVLEVLTRETVEETEQKAEIQKEKQNLQPQLDESKRRYELLTREKKEETQKVESAQHEIKALQQRIELQTEQLEMEKQQVE